MNILETVNFWAKNPYFDPKTRAEAKMLLADDKEIEREDSFGSLLEFGTGGLRGIMGVGTNRINRYTIQMATEGVARIIEGKKNESSASPCQAGAIRRRTGNGELPLDREECVCHSLVRDRIRALW